MSNSRTKRLISALDGGEYIYICNSQSNSSPVTNSLTTYTPATFLCYYEQFVDVQFCTIDCVSVERNVSCCS